MAEQKPNPIRDAHGLPLCSEDACALYDGKRCSALGFRPDRFCEPALVDLVKERKALKARVSELERRPHPTDTTIEQAPPEDLLDRITPEGACRHRRVSMRPSPHGIPETTCLDCGEPTNP